MAKPLSYLQALVNGDTSDSQAIALLTAYEREKPEGDVMDEKSGLRKSRRNRLGVCDSFPRTQESRLTDRPAVPKPHCRGADYATLSAIFEVRLHFGDL